MIEISQIYIADLYWLNGNTYSDKDEALHFRILQDLRTTSITSQLFWLSSPRLRVNVGVLDTPYLSFANTMASLKRNKCLFLLLEPTLTWTHSSSSSSPFSPVRPRTNGLCSAFTQLEASSLKAAGTEMGHTLHVSTGSNSCLDGWLLRTEVDNICMQAMWKTFFAFR